MTGYTIRYIADGVLGDISANGQFISYTTFAGNAFSAAGGTSSLLVQDLTTGSVRTVATEAASANFASGLTRLRGGQLSADGRYIVFSQSSDGEQPSTGAELYYADLQAAGPAELLPTPSASFTDVRLYTAVAAGVSDDGSKIAYGQVYDDPRATGDNESIIVRRPDGTFIANYSRTQVFGDPAKVRPVDISGDGRVLLVTSVNPLLGETDGSNYVYTLDIASGALSSVTGSQGDAFTSDNALSTTGRYAAYTQRFTDGGSSYVILADMQTGSRRVVSLNAQGQAANGFSTLASISADGRYVAYKSTATDITNTSTPGTSALYVTDTLTGATTLISAQTGVGEGGPGDGYGELSADGSHIAFDADVNGAFRVYVADLQAPSINIDTVAGDDFVNAVEKPGAITISGTSDTPHSVITIGAVNSPGLAQATVKADGTWSATVSLAAFGDGALNLTGTVTEFGQTRTVTHRIVIDTSAYATIDPVTSDNVVNAAEAQTGVTLSGRSDAVGQVIRVAVDGTAVGTATVHADGTWALGVATGTLSEGSHAIHVATKDFAGNPAAADGSFAIDRTPPTLAITDVSGDHLIAAGDAKTGVPIAGTSDAIGQTVTITFDGITAGTAMVGTDGTWSTLATKGGTAGAVAIVASVSDPAGNVTKAHDEAFADTVLKRVSVGAHGEQGGGDFSSLGFPNLSADGTTLAYSGFYWGLGPYGDLADGGAQSYVKNLATGALTLATNDTTGSIGGVLSPNGNYLIFTTREALSPLDDNTGLDVYVQDLATGQNRLVSARDDGTASGDSAGGVSDAVLFAPQHAQAVSDDGAIVAYLGTTTDTAPHSGLSYDITKLVVRDLATGESHVVVPQGDLGSVYTSAPQLSADGKVVVFAAENHYENHFDGLLPGSYSVVTGIYGGDWRTGAITLLSSNADGSPIALSDGDSFSSPTMSTDGRYVAFRSNDAIYVKDRQTGTLTLATTDSSGNPPIQSEDTSFRLSDPSLSADGRYVAFESTDQYAGVADPPGDDVFIKDLLTGTLTRAPLDFLKALNPSPYLSNTGAPLIAGDASHIVFETPVAIAADDTNATTDLYEMNLALAEIAVLPVTGDNVLSASEIGAAVAVRGTSDAFGETVGLFVDGASLGTARVEADGTWSTTIDARTLAAGEHRLRSTVTDGAGFTSSDGAVLTVQGTVLTAKVVDGYLAGATVFADTNGNGVLDAGEGSTVTDGTGGFVVPAGTGPLVATGGTDAATGLAFTGTFEAPSGSSILSPLTTLVERLAEKNGDTSSAGIAAANATVVAWSVGHGGQVDLTTLDPEAGTLSGDPAATAAFAAGALIQNLIVLVTKAGGSADTLFNVIADEIHAGGTDFPFGDKTAIATLLSNPALGLPSAVIDAVSTIASATAATLGSQLQGAATPYAAFIDITGASLAAQGSATDPIGIDPGGIAAAYVQNLPAILAAAEQTAAQKTPPCYCRGTRILTARGEVAVEHLAVGDQVITASGGARPIVWIGHRALDLARHPDPKAVWPVRVSADAFADAVPAHDLWLSPGHSVAWNGVLMPVKVLENGISIAQKPCARVEYWHVELDEHDVVIANGLPAESYLDTGNRAGFINGGAFIEAHPDFEAKHWAQTCLPIVHDGDQVFRAKTLVLDRLKSLGQSTTADADLHLMADGRRIEAIALAPMRFAFMLPPEAEVISLRSRTFVPAHTRPDSMDTRSLGLCVMRLQVDGEDIRLDDPSLDSQDWHAVERDESLGDQRWTRGVATIPAKARLVLIDLAGRGYYWQEPQAPSLSLAG